MKSKAYWKERFVQLEQGQFYTAMGEYGKIETFFNQAQKELQDEIELWYSRLANNNGVSMSEAKKLLKGKKLKEFKWDVEQYIQYGKDNALNGQWLKELENASARYHISHLEALKIRTKQAIEKCYHNYGLTATNAVGNSYTSALYKTAYTIQRGFGIGADIAGVDERKLEKLISKPWAADGKNFSERIWDNKEKLVNDLHQSLSRNIMTSGDPKLVIDDLAKKMNTSKTNAGRLIMTENAYFSSLAEKDELHDLGIEEYEIVATLDERTSDICQGMDGMVFKVSEFEPGVNAPPFHVNCRSTTVPHFNENFDLGERAARDKDGKTIKVPADMKYPEWKNKFVKSNSQNPNSINNSTGMFKGYSNKEQQEIETLIDKSPEDVKNMFKKYASQLKPIVEDVDSDQAYFDPSDGCVHLIRSKAVVPSSYQTAYQVHFHEYAHNIDYLAAPNQKFFSANYVRSDGKSFADIIRSDWNDVMYDYFKDEYFDEYFDFTTNVSMGGVTPRSLARNTLRQWQNLKGLSRYDSEYTNLKDEFDSLMDDSKNYKAFLRKHFDKFGKLMYNEVDNGSMIRKFSKKIKSNYSLSARGNLSDMFESYSVNNGGGDYPFGIGHGADYWVSSDYVAIEAFAEMTDASVSSQESLELIKKFLPNAYKAYLEMLKVI